MKGSALGRALLVAAVWSGVASVLPCADAQSHQIGAPAAGLIEPGTPQFSIREYAGMGLDAPPTDLQMLPDGRILVVAPHQLAIGDGLRWETFQDAAGDQSEVGSTVAVDPTGNIYIGVRGGFGRIEFTDNAHWVTKVAARWQVSELQKHPVLTTVAAVGEEWYWHGESGPLIAWKPGEAPRVVGRADTIEQVFQLGEHGYLTDRTNGRLWELGPGGMKPVDYAARLSGSDTLTCAAPLKPGTLLVGTYARGLKIFDGQKVAPFSTQAGLGEGVRVNDLCLTESGSYAAAVEGLGIVFFDPDGRTVQVLDRTIDHRLADVRRLVRAPGGILLGLLSEGLLRVTFPSRLTNFEPLIGTGVTTAHPYRLGGRLWLMADGNILRGAYDDHGRLTGFQVDTPPGRFAFAFSCDTGVPIAGTERGAFYRAATGWVEFAPETVNLRILDPKPVGGRWVYGARDEVGWLSVGPSGVELERIPMPGLDNLYNSETAADGWIWIEQGNARLGRLRLDGPGGPRLQMFGAKDGIPEGWAQVFSIDGDVRFNVGGLILRFDEAQRAFVPDEAFHRRFPGLTGIIGRPGRDARGRFWISANGAVQVFAEERGGWRNLHEDMPPGFLPYYFTFEDDGVVWMHRDRRLARYDPGVPPALRRPVAALITSVTLPASGRSLLPADARLPALPFSDNSLIVHFLATSAPIGGTVNFEVMLEGADTRWVSTGAAGSAAFNHLKEGGYVLHVRPHYAGNAGQEATLRLTILPPWYRTRVAYTLYLLSAVGLVLLAGRVQSLLHRRKNARLERLVQQRTRELAISNEQLSARVEEIRMLSLAIEQSPVAVVMVRVDGGIVFANPRASEMTGYAPPELLGRAIGTLRDGPSSGAALAEMDAALARGEAWHGQLTNRRQDGRLVRVRSVVVPIRSGDGQLWHHLVLEEDITDWLAEQERRRRLEAQLFQAQKLESLGTLAGGIAHDFNNILTGMLGYCELAKLSAGDNAALLQDLEGVRSAGLRARDLVKQILTFSRQGNAKLGPLNLATPVEDALKLVRASTPATIEISSSLRDGTARADATQIQQLVLNLCTNSIHALPDRTGRIEVTLRRIEVTPALAADVPGLKSGPYLRLVVADTGCGMDEATLERMFDPFFTTKPQGEGTGLGLAIVEGILAAHGAARRVRSAVGRGTTFELFFPVSAEPIAPNGDRAALPRGAQEEILVVDDENFVAAFAAKRLRQLGYVPTVFTEPREALAAVSRTPDRYDAIVTDLTMPHLTGADLVEQIRALNPSMPAVIVTGYGREAVRMQVQTLPRCIVLPKPYTGDELAHALRQVLTANA